MTYYSQTYWTWRWNKLGFSSIYTIGSSGCLMTCYSMINDMQPNMMNNYLKANNGFVNVCLLVHSVAADVKSRFKFIYRHDTYDNAKVKEQITRNGFCIVKLSNGKIPQHWVLFIGNQKMVDPIGGIVRPTSYYGTSYVGFVELLKRQPNL